MKRLWLVASTLCLVGCVSNTALEYQAVSQKNLYHITKVRKGMSEKEVFAIMRQPYKYETFELGEDVYDVWFYVTQTTVLGQSRMVPQNLTPLSFRNGILAGTGYDYYYFVTREQAKLEAAQTPPKPPPPAPPPLREPAQTTPPPQPENIELEKSLQKATAPSKQKPSTPQTEQPGNLQKVDQPTAPILSSIGPSPKKLTSFFGVRNPFSGLDKGMSEEDVSALLGKPEKTEVYQLGDDVYDVWFYKKKASNAPLTFKNGLLVGMTQEYYEGIRQAAGDTHVDGYDQGGERMQEAEIEQDFNNW